MRLGKGEESTPHQGKGVQRGRGPKGKEIKNRWIWTDSHI